MPASFSSRNSTTGSGPNDGPHYGLVCMTLGPEVRFRTVTRTHYLGLSDEAKADKLRGIYAHNIATLHAAARYCAGHGIRLFRLSSNLFPMLDLVHDGVQDEVSGAVFAEVAHGLAAAGEAFQSAGIRTLMHPEQFIVLNSENSDVRARSLHALRVHAHIMDAMRLELNHWNMLLLHGGKGGRGAELAALIPDLPDSIRLRLALENDERAYGPADLLPICESTGTPLVFDAHHHTVREGLSSYEHPSVGHWTQAARATWQPPEWQVVHLSNGIDGPNDRRHSHLIAKTPSAYAGVQWIEVEAKGKEEAVLALMGEAPAEAGA